MIIQCVRYRSGLSHEEVESRFRERSDRYRGVPGLLQKYYVRYSATDEYGGVYVWDSAESLQRWRETALAESLSQTYQVEEAPRSELAEVMLVLREAELERDQA